MRKKNDHWNGRCRKRDRKGWDFLKGWNLFKGAALHREAGLDGILVTIGLCIIALLLCVVMKDSLSVFIETIVDSLTTRAGEILTGPALGMAGGAILQVIFGGPV